MGARSRQRRAEANAIDAVNAALQERSWTQNELARQLDTDSAMVSRWMTGQRTPSLRMALAIERLLGVKAALWVGAAA